jgi:hypothetical protein
VHDHVACTNFLSNFHKISEKIRAKQKRLAKDNLRFYRFLPAETFCQDLTSFAQITAEALISSQLERLATAESPNLPTPSSDF